MSVAGPPRTPRPLPAPRLRRSGQAPPGSSRGAAQHSVVQGRAQAPGPLPLGRGQSPASRRRGPRPSAPGHRCDSAGLGQGPRGASPPGSCPAAHRPWGQERGRLPPPWGCPSCAPCSPSSPASVSPPRSRAAGGHGPLHPSPPTWGIAASAPRSPRLCNGRAPPPAAGARARGQARPWRGLAAPALRCPQPPAPPRALPGVRGPQPGHRLQRAGRAGAARVGAPERGRPLALAPPAGGGGP